MKGEEIGLTKKKKSDRAIGRREKLGEHWSEQKQIRERERPCEWRRERQGRNPTSVTGDQFDPRQVAFRL